MASSYESVEMSTASVEKVLESVILQVSLLDAIDGAENRPKGLSRNKDTIIDTIGAAIRELIKKGEEVAQKHSGVAENFQVSLADIRVIGEHFHKSVGLFLDNPADEGMREVLSQAARGLLSSVTRINCLESIRRDAECLGLLTDERELISSCTLLENHLARLEALFKNRIHTLFNNVHRDDLTSAHATLLMGCKMVISSTKANLLHPDMATVDACRSFAVSFTCEAVSHLEYLCGNSRAQETLPPLHGQALSRLMNELVKFAQTGLNKNESWNGIVFQSYVTKLTSEISALVQAAGLVDQHQTEIFRLVQQLDEAVNRFIEAWEFETSTGLRSYLKPIDDVCGQIRSLISRAAITLCSAAFVSNDSVLRQMEESSKCTNEETLVSAVTAIQQQTSDLIDAALCLCGLSNDVNAVRFVRVTACALERLTPQMINAAKAFALRNQTLIIKENFSLFLGAYKFLVQKLRAGMDNMTDESDFLETYEKLLQGDILACQVEAEAGKTGGLMNMSRVLSARCSRINEFILTELEALETDGSDAIEVTKILESIQENLVPQFSEAAREFCRHLRARNASLNFESLRHIGEAIQGAFADIRRILGTMSLHRKDHHQELAKTCFNLQSPQSDKLRPSRSVEYNGSALSYSVKSSSTQGSQSSPLHLLRNEAPGSLVDAIDRFYAERTSLMGRIGGSNSNEIDGVISLSRSICSRLTDIIDHLENGGRGSIMTHTELVQVAREVSQIAAEINGFIEEIARSSSDPSNKMDLLDSARNITFCSHELASASRVKKNMDAKTDIFFLDNAISLVYSASSLMSAITQAIDGAQLASDQMPLHPIAADPAVTPRHIARGIRDTAPSTFVVKVDRAFNFTS
uniref:Conserved oligomeric Golgi complex subunit 4 n=2 Tax=Mesocestoides corti TaxID=53468 RepID=A0A5K3FUD0_MESCO